GGAARQILDSTPLLVADVLPAPPELEGELLQRAARIADDPEVYRIVLRDRRRVDIDLNQRGSRLDGDRPRVRDELVQRGADHQEHVDVPRREILLRSRMPAEAE